MPGVPDDRIELRGLRVVGTHGVLAEEQERAQPFEVDLDLAVDLRPAGVSDALADTVDYGAVADTVAATVSGPRSFALLEALAWHVADAVLDVDHRITRVTVALRKLRPPAGRRHRHGGRAGGPHPVTLPWPRQPTRRAFLSLGSNLGDRESHLRRAVDQLRAGSTPTVTAVSQVYETDPVGGPEDQGAFLNLVVELAVPLDVDPYRVLQQCHRLEAAAGRVRTVRWGPRTPRCRRHLDRRHHPRRPGPHPSPPPVAGAAVRAGPAGRVGSRPGGRRRPGPRWRRGARGG